MKMVHWFFTVSRIIVAPVAFFLLSTGSVFSTPLILYAILSDILDGYFARKNNQCTQFGALMDAFADKLFLYACILAFLPYLSHVRWIFIFWIIRDFILCIRYIVNNKQFKSLKIGKFYTGLQFLFILFGAPKFFLPLFVVFGYTSIVHYYNAIC